MRLNKLTNGSAIPARRRYEDACGAAHALDLVGERWALLVIRELMLGPKRFSDLRASLPGISANVLTQRLEGLEAVGVLVRRRTPPPTPARLYELTPWGYESEPIFQALGRWAARSPGHDPSLPLSTASLILSFRTMFDPQRAKGVTASIGLQIGAESFLVRIADGRCEAVRGGVSDTDVQIIGTASSIAAAVYGAQPLSDLEMKEMLRIEGRRDIAERFITLFPLPPKTDQAH